MPAPTWAEIKAAEAAATATERAAIITAQQALDAAYVAAHAQKYTPTPATPDNLAPRTK